MQTNIHAYTETDYAPANYPAYLSLNERADGSTWLTVRSRGGQTASEVALTRAELDSLYRSLRDHFGYF